MKDINWAVLGTGVIANEMAVALKKNGKEYMLSVTEPMKKQLHLEKYGTVKYMQITMRCLQIRSGCYLYHNSHNTHKNFMRRAIENGKHILVEKSITLNSRNWMRQLLWRMKRALS